MAQIIKHRRGSINQLKDVTAKAGELVMATGSINDLNGPFIFIGETENAVGGYRSVSKLYSGNQAPTISSLSYGTVLDGTPYYSAGNETLYILSSNGNTALDLTGNIEGNTISGVTINKLVSTNVSASFFTGSFKGDGTNLFNIPATGVTGLNLSRIASGSYTASISESGGFRINTDTSITGTLKVTDDVTFEQDLYVSGDIYQTGSFYTQGNIVLSGSINIGNSLTGDTINFGGEVNSHIIPTTNDTFDLGTSAKAWKDLYVSGTAYIENINIGEVSLTNLGLPGTLIVSGQTSLSGAVFIENALTVTGNTTVSGDFLANGSNSTLTANYGGNNIELVAYNGATIDLNGPTNINGNTILSGSVKVTGSFYNDQLTNNRVVIVGTNGLLEDDANFTFDGTTLKVGNGDFEVDVLSGDTRMSGSLIVKNDATVTGSLFATKIEGTGSLYLQPDQSDGRYFEIYNTSVSDTHIKSSAGLSFFGDDTNYLVINDSAQTATIVGVNGVFISSSLKVTGSVNVSGGASITGAFTVASGSMTSLGGDLYVSGNLQVLGSATEVLLQSQIIELDDNIIRLNAYSPFQRYAGFEVIDSGSTGESGSMVWDSQNDYWMFVSSSGQSSKFVGTTAGTYGSETSLTSGTFPIASASNTIGDSLLTYSGTTLAFNTNKFTIDSGNGNTMVYGNVTLSYSGGTDSGSYTSNIVFRNNNDVLGFVGSNDTTNVTDRLLGYNSTTGVLEFSSLIDGGTY